MDEEGGTHHYPRYLLRKFIELYRENTCLWDHSDYYFREKTVKAAAINKLVKLVKVHIPETTRDSIIKKIECIRSCYRREKSRIQKRLDTGCKYEPSLWYYKHLSFLEDSNIAYNKTSQQSPQLDDESDAIEIDEPALFIVKETKKNTKRKTALKKKITQDIQTLEVEKQDVIIEHFIENEDNYYNNDDSYNNESQFNNSKFEIAVDTKRKFCEMTDEYDAIGMNVAAKLRAISPQARIIAEKLINDVLFQAQVNGLTTSSQLIN